MGEIRISIPSEDLGFPYPVCKKSSSHGLMFNSVVALQDLQLSQAYVPKSL